MVEEVVNIYRDLAKYPTPTEGSLYNIQDKNVHVYTEWTERDIERVEKIKFTKHYILETEQEKIKPLIVTPPQEIQNELYSRLSTSGTLRAIVRKLKSKSGETKHFIEVWSEKLKLQNIDLEACGKHGKIYSNDSSFGVFEWSSCDKKLMYLAEKKNESRSFFDKTNAGSDVGKGDKTLFKEGWGDQFSEYHHSVICIFYIETQEISVIDQVPDNVSPAKPRWFRGNEGIVFTGYFHDPYRLGLLYTRQRKSSIFYVDMKSSQCTMLSRGETYACQEVSTSPDGKKITWLQHPLDGAKIHSGSVVLKMCDWETKEISTVVDIVQSPKDHEFPGIYLYATGLCRRYWSNDSNRVILTSQWRNRIESAVINLRTKSVTRISKECEGAWFVLDVLDDYVLVACASIDTPYYLVMGKLPAEGEESSITWHQLDRTSPVVFNDVNWSVIKHDIPPERIHPEYPQLDHFHSILIQPNSSKIELKKSPVAVYIHGGPHIVANSGFTLIFAGLCKAGFTVLCVNYRGSWGYGQDSIECTRTKIGTMDVEDIQSAINEVIGKYPVDGTNCFVFGGSYGGTLALQVIGQYPDFYKAASMRNPSTNLATFTKASDIPDWALYECGYDFDYKMLVTDDMMSRMWSLSPMQYVDRVKTPTIFFIGKYDERVPPSQGLAYFRALKARGAETRLHYYEDAHPLMKIDVEADWFINLINWFKQHMDNDSSSEYCAQS
ncbi:acylamino-acid-releasing enzyme-like [Tubulanus polymorphus]|uniref:acylamino-acid-releasing enzyme-like n=1 Tax=Tubulanus polymorphus TaxID=672921 RepID=UPI003DA682AE